MATQNPSIQIDALSNLELRAHEADILKQRAAYHRAKAEDSRSDRISRQYHNDEAKWLEDRAEYLYPENPTFGQKKAARYL